MAISWLNNPGRNRKARYAIALLLLSLSFLDLTVIDMLSPELCGGECEIASVAQAAIVTGNVESGDRLIVGETIPQDPDSSAPLPFEEDCFCCCAHILPGAYFRLPALQLRPERVSREIALLPSAPPYEMFHPPRTA